MTEPVKVLFVGGPGRSGSTLLERMLGSVPGVCAVGEFHAFWRRGVLGNDLCGCGESVPNCPFWVEVVGRAFGGFDSQPAQQHAEDEIRLESARWSAGLRFAKRVPRHLRPTLARFGRERERIFRAIAEVAGASLVVDSSKHPRYGVALKYVPGLDVRVVDLIRDSRAVSYSWSTLKQAPRTGGHTSPMPQYPAWQTASRWNTRRAQLELGWAFTGRRLGVHYEEFVDRPARTTRRILQFAKHESAVLPPAGVAPRSYVLGVHHTVLGNPMRFDRGEIQIRRDDRWKTAMEPDDRKLVTRKTWPLLLRYGYIGPFKRPWAREHGGNER